MTASPISNECKAGEGHLVIHPDGQTEFVTQVELGVEGRQAIIGGRYDYVILNPCVSMWIHDEGRFLCDLNPVATALFQRLAGTDDTIWGTVILSGVNYEGETQPLPAADVAYLRELLEQLTGQRVPSQHAHLVSPQSVSEDSR